ncbi:MAG: hypothetical protein OXJ90_09285 [Spirochaetaceae bacterium]|nr:hypothetical protein [Spirochaetaceae bacterium]
MHKMIQIRNVPEPLHRKLKARAAMAGMSLSAYLLEQITVQASVPTPQELTARIERLKPVTPRESVVEALQRTRDER